jgi:pyruvate/2-oxoglutarate dehydrogenase complex dihydrolipoamide acyltransferase (E2) component
LQYKKVSELPWDLLCTLETTKSTAEVVAESEGFVVNLHVTPGQLVAAGENLCYLAESPEWKPVEAELPSLPPDRARTSTNLPDGLRITQPALRLAVQSDLDLHQLPFGPLVTENMIRELIANSQRALDLPSGFDPKSILIYGGGGHGKTLIELIQAKVYDIVGSSTMDWRRISRLWAYPS